MISLASVQSVCYLSYGENKWIEIIELFLEGSFSGDLILSTQTGAGLGFYFTDTFFKQG